MSTLTLTVGYDGGVTDVKTTVKRLFSLNPEIPLLIPQPEAWRAPVKSGSNVNTAGPTHD